MKLKLQKRMAANLFKSSKKRVKFDNSKLSEIKEAITKSDIRKLMSEGIISNVKSLGNSRSRARKILNQKRKNRRKGRGTKKGKATANLSRKEKWVNKIRLQRKLLKLHKEKKEISDKTYTLLRKKAKGGFFRSKRHLELFIKDHNLIDKK